MNITRADQSHVTGVARLFDLYRQFYECDADLPLATRYISERIENDESVIFVATVGDTTQGFVQLYPSFCSVEAIRILVLYDLFVDVAGRNKGIGARLMNRATEYARESGAVRLDLLTEKSNHAGQHLYEKLGYKIVNEEFLAYSLYA
ncbi:MAG: GNAT family N-acetyltransferase [Gammaproteobacteria bacterium]|nr:GNAT family N-acetyltransferase [Gammaproteobacteria bacterium]